MKDFLKRSWAEIDLDSICHNLSFVRSKINPKTKVMCVVKADAYGHCDVPVAAALSDSGADWFAVSNIEEGLSLRNGGITKPILIFGQTPVEYAKVLIENSLTQTVFSLEYAKALSKEAASPIDVHIKLDTGMTRVGFVLTSKDYFNNSIDEIIETCGLENINAKGIYTHFSCADDLENPDITHRQFELFGAAIDTLKQNKLTFELTHCCNSAGVLYFPQYALDIVRPGILLYGLSPSKEHFPNLSPAMKLITTVSMVKTVGEGNSVSYGATYKTTEKTKIASVPLGYADGFPRALSSKGNMVINGKIANIIGRICMDQTMLDVTGIDDVTEGNIVTVFGTGENDGATATTIADLTGTINYEIICLVGKRVPRIIYKDKKIIKIVDNILPN